MFRNLPFFVFYDNTRLHIKSNNNNLKTTAMGAAETSGNRYKEIKDDLKCYS